jgi:hypothetical protein
VPDRAAVIATNAVLQEVAASATVVLMSLLIPQEINYSRVTPPLRNGESQMNVQVAATPVVWTATVSAPVASVLTGGSLFRTFGSVYQIRRTSSQRSALSFGKIGPFQARKAA